MLVKYINENSVRLYNGVVEIDSVMYANDYEKAQEAGFMPLVSTPKPEGTDDVIYVRTFESVDNKVMERWKATRISEEVS